MNAITVKDASFSYNGKDYVWENLNLSIEEGESFCILGANGSGKTTLFSCLNGDYKLTKGNIYLYGKDIKEYSYSEIARIIGTVFQEHVSSFPYTVLEMTAMGRAPHIGMFSSPDKEDKKLAYDALAELGIDFLADKKYTNISGGERQLVLIARTLCQQPKIILFDEPTSHLDFKNQAIVLKTMKRLSGMGYTIITNSHFPQHAFQVSDRCALLKKGALIAAGDTWDVMTEENLKETYGIAVNIIKSEINGKTAVFCEADL